MKPARLLSILLLLPCLFVAACGRSAPKPVELNAQQSAGKRVFDAHCVLCHDATSDAPRQGPGMKELLRKQYLPSGIPANDERVEETIREGRVGMPGFKDQLTDQQIEDLIAYLHTL